MRLCSGSIRQGICLTANFSEIFWELKASLSKFTLTSKKETKNIFTENSPKAQVCFFFLFTCSVLTVFPLVWKLHPLPESNDITLAQTHLTAHL